ncbi:MAG: preprotein translocase subunit YajC [Synergistaceae bacterium]|jgi:preprotein translocase subunit YajC|nr:preprotein translocase subunit YajC [Synergistaceae bacterium]
MARNFSDADVAIGEIRVKMFGRNSWDKMIGGFFLSRIFGVMTALLLPAAGFAAEEGGGTAPATRESITGMALPIVLFIVIFYFLMYRPQKKKQQQHDKMISSIGRGDTVVTAGGFLGKICEVLDDSYIIELADGVRARILKSSVSSRREGGDDKLKPRRLKKKKRERAVDAEADKNKETSAADGDSPKPQEDGVSMEENAVLLESPETVSGESKTSSDSTN